MPIPKTEMESDSSQSIEVTIEAEAWKTIVTDPYALIVKSAATALGELAPELQARAEVNILLTDDCSIRLLNKRHRGRDKPTNVLSFPIFARREPWPAAGALLLGDIVMAHETIMREAGACPNGVPSHIAHLVIHGVLHLIGHDHEDDDDALAMETAERRLLAQLGWGDPYAGDEEGQWHVKEAV